MRWLLLALLAAGCGDEPIEPIRRPAVDDPTFEVPGAVDQRGTVLVARQQGSDQPIDLLVARFTDAADPGPYTLVAEEGPCRLLERCAAGECAADPTALDAGPITVSGISAEYSLEVDDALSYRGEGGDDLYATDAAIEVVAAGQGEVPGFTGGVPAVEPLSAEIDPGALVTVPTTTDFVVEWDEPAAASSTRVRLTLRTGEADAGIPRDKLVCDADDTGTLRVPSSILRQLPRMVFPSESGQDGCDAPCAFSPSSLARYRAAETAWNGGTVQIVSASEILFWGIHAGR